MMHYAPLVALMTTLLVLTLILIIGRYAVVHDILNERSLHDKATPRLVMVAYISAGWLLLSLAKSW